MNPSLTPLLVTAVPLLAVGAILLLTQALKAPKKAAKKPARKSKRKSKKS